MQGRRERDNARRKTGPGGGHAFLAAALCRRRTGITAPSSEPGSRRGRGRCTPRKARAITGNRRETGRDTHDRPPRTLSETRRKRSRRRGQ
jgi:hypothetical protein